VCGVWLRVCVCRGKRTSNSNRNAKRMKREITGEQNECVSAHTHNKRLLARFIF